MPRTELLIMAFLSRFCQDTIIYYAVEFRTNPSQVFRAPKFPQQRYKLYLLYCANTCLGSWATLPAYCRYAEKDANMTFSATPLGEALVSGYRAMGLANLWTPDLRGKIEAGISAVAAGQRTKVHTTIEILAEKGQIAQFL